MKAEEHTIGRILTEQSSYEIPAYQRPYSWEIDNVEKLLADVWESYQANDTEYFIGSLITIEKEKNKLYEVVDGQQRLTTLNLIFAKLRDKISDAAAKAELGKRILPCNVLTGAAETPRLLLRKSDRGFFRQYVLDAQAVPEKGRDKLPAPQQRIAENLDAINKFFNDKSEQVLKLFANYLLTSVYAVFVTTDSTKSAYRLFNVLNARGLSLSNSDLIKNTLFSQLGAQGNRSDELEDRWQELEEKLGIDRLDAFFGHHHTSMVASKARGALHEEFEPVISGVAGGPFAFLDMAISSAENYMHIMSEVLDDAVALRALRALRNVGFDEWIPPLLAYLNKPVVDLPAADFISLLEKITIQNWVRRLGRSARLTVYFQLISAIRAEKNAIEVREIFRKNSNNDEFFSLLGGEIYTKPFAKAVLLRLDEAAQDDSVTKTYSGQLTIEHVLPQALKEQYWKDRFDESQHQFWIHRLGNLAMLCGSKNYKAQCYNFERKKEIYEDRNKTVSFDLTKEVLAAADWNVVAIQKRQERMVSLARDIWTIN